MSDTHKPNRSLSEISHLFLSGVRDRQTSGAPRPVRRPPGSHVQSPAPPPNISVDLTPEEFAEVFGAAAAAAEAPDKIPSVTAVVSAHLNGAQHDRVREYARHLASGGQRVGLIEVDTNEFRLTCFDCGAPSTSEDAPAALATENFDARRMAEALDEMTWDMDRWLLVLPNPRTPEARGLLREVDHWTMLSTCDHDGVVSCYRTLKGLSDLHRPQLTLGLLDVRDEQHAAKVFRKLSGVCEQFLRWPVAAEPTIWPADHVAEHVVMFCRQTRDKAQLAIAPQWQIAANFLEKMKSGVPARGGHKASALDEQAAVDRHGDEPPQSEPATVVTQHAKEKPAMFTDNQRGNHNNSFSAVHHVADVILPAAAPVVSAVGARLSTGGVDRESGKELPAASPALTSTDRASIPADNTTNNDVIDLASDAADSASIITAIIRNAGGELIDCPVRPPMCPEAHLAIDRNRQLTLVAVAGEGLGELRSIAQAYRWLLENRALVAMALPQFAIDALRVPLLRLLVDHADLSAELLQPMLQSGNVTVQAYRKLRWGAKLGLLLEAA